MTSAMLEIAADMLKPNLLTKKDKDTLAEEIQDKHRKSFELKQSLVDEWWTSVNFVNGNQYVAFRAGQAVSPKAPRHRVRLTNNMCGPIVTTLVAKLTRNRPGVVGIPRSADDKAVKAAPAVENIYNYFHKKCELQQRLRQAVWWSLTTGTGFLKWSWNPMGGQPLVEPMTNALLGWSGIPLVEVVEPFDVYPDWDATDLLDCKWLILAHSVPVDVFKEQFGKKAKKALDNVDKGHNSWESTDYLEQIKREVTGYSATGNYGEADLVNILEYEEAPSLKYPSGRRVLVSNSIILHAEELVGGKFSLAMVRSRESGGRFWGRGVVADVIDQQRELNRTKSQAVELRNLHTNPQWVAAAGTIVGSIKNAPDAVVNFNPNLGPPPRRMDPVPIPPSLFTMAQDLKQEMMDISGAQEISFGGGQSDLSGRAIGYLSDLEEGKLGPAVEEIERTVESMANGIIELWRRHTIAPLTISILGESRTPEIMTIHSTTIENLGIEVRANSLLPRLPSFQVERIRQNFQVGIYGSPQDPMVQQRVRRLIGQYGAGSQDPDDSDDRQYSRLENELMAMGSPGIQPSWWENHAIHYEECIRYMKTPEYRDLDEVTQRTFEVHAALHRRMMQLEMQGVDTSAHVLGEDPFGQGGMQQAPKPGGSPPMMGASPEEMTAGAEGPPPGAWRDTEMAMGAPMPREGGGGTPEINQAMNQAGPGVNPFEEGGI